jgi:hypothetical protein
MAFTNEQVLQWFLDNPNATDAQIAQTAAAAGVSAQQLSQVTGVPVQQVQARAQSAGVDLPAVVPSVGLFSSEISTRPVARQITETVDQGSENGSREVTRTVYEPAPGAPTVKYNDGTEYDSRLIKQLAMELTQQVGPLQGKVFDTKGESIGFNFAEAKKILGSDNVTAYDQVLLDAAAGLAKQGITSLKDLQPQKITVMVSGGEGPDYPEEQTQIINRNTGQVVDANIGRTFTGKGNTSYSLVPDASGQLKLTTQGNSSMDTLGKFALTAGAMYAGTALPGILGAGGLGLNATATGALTGAATGALNAAANEQNILKGALGGAVLGGVAGYSQGANAPAPGLGPQTDASFLAADAAQLAAQGLSESAINQVLGASGYASGPAASLAASMAVNGLDVGMMTQQLDALSTNTGLMSQTGSSADFLAADALQLQGQLGNNFPAIEQNLIASGVDPLIAADVSQQLAFNPGLTQSNLATNLANSFGNNIYDVNMATTYPTSVLPGAGGLLSDVAGVTSTTTPAAVTPTTTPPASGLTPSQISNLLKAGLTLAGTGAAVGAIGGGNNMPLQAPTQGVPTNDPNYYNQLQQYYNSYLPQTPRDVVTPLQQWYNSSYGA